MPYLYSLLDKIEMENDIKLLMTLFKIIDLGSIKEILGMRVTRDRAARTLTLSHEHHIKQILKDYGYEQCRIAETPESTGIISSKSEDLAQVRTEIRKELDQRNNRMVITADTIPIITGRLSYVALTTRPDISHAVNMLQRDQVTPTEETIQLARRIIRYLAGTQTLGLTYRYIKTGFSLSAYSDADWAGDPSDAKSTTGSVIMLGGAAINWLSVKQQTVAKSSTEAEYIAASETVSDIIWARQLLTDLSFDISQPTVLHVDNRTAIMMIESTNTQHNRRKHINVKHHFIREKKEEGVITAEWIDTKSQLADIMTKPLPHQQFKLLRDIINGTTQTK